MSLDGLSPILRTALPASVGRAVAYAAARPWVQLGLLLAAGLAVRMLLAVVLLPETGFKSDMVLWADWAHRLDAAGPGAFYRPDAPYFNDYPPVFPYVLWSLAEFARLMSTLTGGADMTVGLLKVPFIAADIATAAAVYGLGRQLGRHRLGMIAAAIFVFNPAVLFDSTIWGQDDSIGVLFVVLSLYMLLRGRTEWASALAVVAALVKFQFAFIIPIIAVVAIRRHLFGRSEDPTIEARRDYFRIGRSLVAGFGTLVAVCWPVGLALYSAGDKSHSLWARFLAAGQAFPGITQNAFNLWMNPLADVIHSGGTGLTEGHVVNDAVAIVALGGLTVTWQAVGNVLFLAIVALALAVVARHDDGPTIIFAALIIAVAFFALPTRVHERYLYPALALGAPLVLLAAWPRRMYVALSAVVFLDLFWVYTLPIGNMGLSRPGLLNDTVFSAPGIYLTSALTVVCIVWLTVVGVRLAAGSRGLVDLLGRAGAPYVAAGAPMATAAATPGGGTGAADSPVPAEPTPLAEPTPEPSLEPPDPAPAPAAEPPMRRPPHRPRVPVTPRVRLARNVVLLALASFAAALIAARVSGSDGPWLWNLDMPKIDYPLASFFHDALTQGRLPLWNDQLGLGYPLYAEGQIGAFYPPNWLIYLLPPLQALDATRVLHLTLAGTGAGLIALKLSGGQKGAVLAAVAVVLSGGIVSKLEWTNFVVAYGWLPWVLLPLTRRGGPTRVGLVAAGIAWGIQALAGHPNLWLFTGIAAATLIVATYPRLVSLARVAGFGLLGGAIGSIQLLSTLLLTPLSVRSAGLSANDLFASSSTPLDVLGFAFSNVFVRSNSQAWNLSSAWYPNGPFALLEATAYVGLPVLILAAIAVTVRRARPLVIVAMVMAAIPIVAAFRPSWWTEVPFLDALRSPVRTYVVVDVMIALLAAVGVARLGRQKGARGRIAGVLAIMLGGYALLTLLAVAYQGTLADLIKPFSIFNSPTESAKLAESALTSPFPLLAEVVIGLAVAALAFRPRPSFAVSARWMAISVVGLAIAPLVGFIPQANSPGFREAFISLDSPFTQALQQADAHRLLTVGEPGWYAGMPDQLATAGVPDVRMFSSLNLLASDQLLGQLRADDATALRRAVGIDTIVTFGKDCPGTPLAQVTDPTSTVCRDTAAAHPPYWFAAAAVTVSGPGAAWPATRPVDATVDPAAAVASAVSANLTRWDTTGAAMTVDQPTDGWLWLDRAWYPSWRVAIDGQTVPTYRAMAGTLIRVPAGSHVVEESLVPFEAGLGLLAGIVALAIALAWCLLGRRAAGAAGSGGANGAIGAGRANGAPDDGAPDDGAASSDDGAPDNGSGPVSPGPESG